MFDFLKEENRLDVALGIMNKIIYRIKQTFVIKKRKLINYGN